MKRLRFFAYAVLVTLSATPAAHATTFTSIVALGDSLSDTGNAFIFTGLLGDAIPQPPYFDGNFSNGPVWLEVLAAGLGLSVDPSKSSIDPVLDTRSINVLAKAASPSTIIRMPMMRISGA